MDKRNNNFECHGSLMAVTCADISHSQCQNGNQYHFCHSLCKDFPLAFARRKQDSCFMHTGFMTKNLYERQSGYAHDACDCQQGIQQDCDADQRDFRMVRVVFCPRFSMLFSALSLC